MMDSALFDAMVLHIRNGASQTRAGTDKLRKHVDALIADRDALRHQVAVLRQALEAAPEAYLGWAVLEDFGEAYEEWWAGQRQAALGQEP